MTQLELGALEGRKRRDEGIARVSSKNSGWLKEAREVAYRIARMKGTVTAEDVRGVLYARGLRPSHPNAWGGVFKDPRFVWTGNLIPSRVPSRHANLQRVWRLSTDAGS